jgi:hypothetical protein
VEEDTRSCEKIEKNRKNDENIEEKIRKMDNNAKFEEVIMNEDIFTTE